MPVFDPSLTANKVASMIEESGALNASGKPVGSDAPSVPDNMTVKGHIDATRRGRAANESLGPELEVIKEQRQVRVRIFNVGPFSHTIPCGSAGTFYIPACPDGKDYIEMLTPLYAVETEIYPKTRGGNPPKRLYDEGRRMAKEILGEGRNQHKANSKRRVGVFIASDDVPSQRELHEANAQMHAYAEEQILYMDNLWDRDRKLAHEVFRPETFGACARFLGLTGKQKPWLAQGKTQAQIKCPMCHTDVDSDAPICFNCKSVVNQESYLAMKAQQENIAAATAPSEKKGK